MTPWTSSIRPQDVVSVVLGGGAGTRLFPLTKDRAKPAVPLGGKYRLVDIPISNWPRSSVPIGSSGTRGRPTPCGRICST